MSSTDGEQRMATILEINMTAMKIVAQDDYGSTLYISLQLHDPLVAIPAIGERWLVERQGIDWFLEMRAENGSESTAISSLSPGDRRIEAAADLHLNGKNVFVNEKPLLDTPDLVVPVDSDRILVPMNQYFSEGNLAVTTGRRYLSRFITNRDFTFTRIRYNCNGAVSTDLLDVGVFDANLNPVITSGPLPCTITGLVDVTLPQTTLPGNQSWFAAIAFSVSVNFGIVSANVGSSNYGHMLTDHTSVADSYSLALLISNGFPLAGGSAYSAYTTTSLTPIMALLP